ncbi:uncharacterized protein C8R40DRAFT_365180 [Lentinula edodes]|uniref:uncharacterized protein n=1 Tax=Lentinula edodes TaxID=5353 RepID=UPI001E8D4661|nr:uncharacterized protein C8R40DRAFT_365180 [Lentinula edodes]KAH7873519.1 hypothetical protein C8R40DRAFT_365180 [Lentinula edodes]
MGATNVVRWLTTCIALAAFFELRVTAQDTDAVCTLASLQWSFNTEKQSPCAVASSLLGVCSGGDYKVVALPDTDTEYLGPSIDAANPCQCNTVVYSLMSACALCQNGTIITWSEWITNCAPIYTTFPKLIPDGLRVPAYAYLDVETQDTFDANAAMQDMLLSLRLYPQLHQQLAVHNHPSRFRKHLPLRLLPVPPHPLQSH